MMLIETYLLAPLVLLVVVLISTLLDRWSVPVILVALGTGILFGSDGLGFWHYDNITLTNQIANAALVFILFQGGIGTRRESFESVALVAGGLATWGVILTALTVFGVLWGILNWSLETAALLAAIISSTDSAATFSILRRQALTPKLSSTVEIESAANDPMAILLTLAVIEFITSGTPQWSFIALSFIWRFAAGIALGWILGHAAVWFYNYITPKDRGHYYVLTIAIVLMIYGLVELLVQASGMLAVFVAGYTIGNRPFVHKQGVTNFSSAISTIADIGMFILMGLLISPKQWVTLWPQGVVLFLVLTFIARPVAVWLGTLGMKVSAREKIFISWAGLRGAVPIILGTYPIAAGIPIGQEVFNLVFFAVILSVSVQGSTLGVLAKWLKLSTVSRPKPLYNLELITMAKNDVDLIVVDIPGPLGSPRAKIREMKLPPGSVITLITRGKDVVVPLGNTRLQGGDQVTILGHIRDEAEIRRALTTDSSQVA